MFEKNKNNQQPDALDERIHGLRNGLRASARLKAAAISGEPLRTPAVTTQTHVRRFAKAIAVYAVCAVVLLGVVLVLPSLLQGNEPAPANPTTTKPNELTPTIPPVDEVFSDEMLVQIDAAYIDKYNRSLEFDQTGIHEVWYLGTYNDGIVFYKKFEIPDGPFISWVDELEIAGREFSLSSMDALCVYKNGTVKRVDEAFESGWLSREDFTQIIQQYESVLKQLFDAPGDSHTAIEKEIISAYAKQFGRDESKLSVRIVAEYDGVYAVYVDEAGFAYEDEMIEEVVHFYPFRYTNTQTMSIYKDGRIYTLPEAYEAGVFTAKNVLDLYLLHAEKEGYLDEKDPEKFYCPATLENEFTEDGIIIIVFPEYNFESYTVDDFSEIGCIEVKELSYDVEAGVLNRFILLTLDEKSKQNVLDCIQVLQQRVDIYSAEPNLIGHFD